MAQCLSAGMRPVAHGGATLAPRTAQPVGTAAPWKHFHPASGVSAPVGRRRPPGLPSDIRGVVEPAPFHPVRGAPGSAGIGWGTPVYMEFCNVTRQTTTRAAAVRGARVAG